MFNVKKTTLNRSARRRALRLEGMERKSMFAADASFSYDAATDTVRVEGSDYADQISISVDDQGTASTLDDTLEIKVTYDKNPILPGVTVKAYSHKLHELTVSGFPPVIQVSDIVDRVVVESGNGNDTIINNTDIPMTAEGGDGNDVILGGSAADRLYGQDGNDVLRGRSGVDFLYGGDGRDQLFGGDDNDWLYGNDGNDELNGDDGEDHLFGGRGEDRLDGGMDGVVDHLDGGPGVYTDAFRKEMYLKFDFPELTLQQVNREDFVDFNPFNDVDTTKAVNTDPTVVLPSDIGDVNANGKSDIVDFGILRSNFNKAGERNDGDLTGDGKVNLLDFAIMRANFNESADYDFLRPIIIPDLVNDIVFGEL